VQPSRRPATRLEHFSELRQEAITTSYFGRRRFSLRAVSAPTVEDLAKRFFEEHAAKKRPSTQEQYRHSIDRYILPALKHRKVAEVDYADADSLHRKVTEEAGPYKANRVLACMSKAVGTFAGANNNALQPPVPRRAARGGGDSGKHHPAERAGR
jgi:hypothetical protein